MSAGARADFLGMRAAPDSRGSTSGESPLRLRPFLDSRGVVIVEYVVVLLLVSMLACGAILLLGMAMSKFYFSQEAWIGIPLP